MQRHALKSARQCTPKNPTSFYLFAMNLKNKCIMEISIVTKEDLHIFKSELLEKIESLMTNQPEKKEEEQVWIKSHHVQRMLGISAATLQNLRVNGTMPYSKIGGVIFYDKSEVLAVLNRNKQNS
jgi:hypothetical protein